MKEIYDFGVGCGLLFFGSISIALLLAIIGYISYMWVNDKEKPFDSDCHDNIMTRYMGGENNHSGDVFGCLVTLIVIFAVGTYTWPLAVPVLFVIASMYGLRGFVRFKKKVNSVLETKVDKEDE